jgi:hypothetical protein
MVCLLKLFLVLETGYHGAILFHSSIIQFSLIDITLSLVRQVQSMNIIILFYNINFVLQSVQ